MYWYHSHVKHQKREGRKRILRGDSKVGQRKDKPEGMVHDRNKPQRK